jgi:2-polyprenyl-3-methyl-5-hydroxy-6-metoxy-1,4-benzoquinol methylase
MQHNYPSFTLAIRMTIFEKSLFDAAVAPYQQAGKFATHFARGKLTGDPVFKEILQRGLIASNTHLLDIGCGQGLLSAWMLAADNLASDPGWPSDWQSAPRSVTVKGIELMPADVVRAEKALAAYRDRFTFAAGDMCSTPFDKADTVVILDVLHYVPYAAQEDVLQRVREALSPKGLLILRVGDAAGGWGFKISNWVDSIVTLVRGHSLSRLYCRPLTEWVDLLTRLGFQVESKPMSQGTPFANVLLLARLEG